MSPQQVVFQNLACKMLPPVGSGRGPLAAAAAPGSGGGGGGGGVASPTLVEVDYTPVEYLGQPLVSTFTQFLVR